MGESKRPAEAEANRRQHQLQKAASKRLRAAREAEKLHAEQEFQRAVDAAKKKLDLERQHHKRKRKTYTELLTMLDLSGVRYHTLRSADEYVPKTYNLDRQLYGLIDHLFVQYETPYFLYKCLTKEGALHPMNDAFKQWFLTVSQGGSFRRFVRELMTSKEASVFLRGSGDWPIFRYVWWAKMKVAGIPESTIDKIIDKLYAGKAVACISKQDLDLICFFGKHHGDFGKEELGEVLDFLAWKLPRDPEWSLKGRTASSLIKLSNEWHVLIQKAKLGGDVKWQGIGWPEWEHVEKGFVCSVQELTNNKELLNEGRKQLHCVYSYVQRCVAGQSYIFSLRTYEKGPVVKMSDGTPVVSRGEEKSRLTIEVNKQRAVIQARGRFNCGPTPQEKLLMRMWAGSCGIVTRP